MDRDRDGVEDTVQLRRLAEKALGERDFQVELPPAARAQADALRAATLDGRGAVRDLTALPWSSIDNDDSRDLDQIEVAERAPGGVTRIRIGIADIDAFVPPGSPLDDAALHNTTTVYTAGGVFPMLPRKLSEDLTSLLEDETRLAVVTELDVGPEGDVQRSDHYTAIVRSRAKLAYDGVSAWLEGRAPAPRGVDDAIADQIRLQDAAAQALRRARLASGALGLDSREPRTVRDERGRIVDIDSHVQTRAGALVEDLMIAVNSAVARFLEAKGFPSIRRAVKTPDRWDRIVELSRTWGGSLPPSPDPRALSSFLSGIRRERPERFDEISLAVIKLIGRGEYVAKRPGETPPGHFGLAVHDYAHSTAPNRRYPDVATQRLLKAACSGAPPPYTYQALSVIAARCSAQERNAKKVERMVQKSAAALLLADRVGQVFDGVITGATEKGTWVRIRRPAVEGKVHQRGPRRLDVGDVVRVRLQGTDVARGFIDFVPVLSRHGACAPRTALRHRRRERPGKGPSWSGTRVATIPTVQTPRFPVPPSPFLSSLMVGAAATGLDLLVVALLVEGLHLPPASANVPALLVGAIVQFFGCRLVFGATGGSFLRQLSAFVVAELGTLALNAAVFHVLVSATPVPYAAARLVGQAAVYLGFSYPAWKRVFAATSARA
jgi:exoribonuclease II